MNVSLTKPRNLDDHRVGIANDHRDIWQRHQIDGVGGEGSQSAEIKTLSSVDITADVGH